MIRMLDSIRTMFSTDRPASATNTLADLARRFAHPRREYSPVPIWWWSGERLDPARLRWQLEQFVAGGVYNLVVLNLAPAGPLYGSDADDPPCFSEAWWQIFLGVCADARELGVRLWFYDQIGFSGANLQGRLVRDTPAFVGQWLDAISVEGDGPLSLACPPGGEPLGAAVTDLGTGITTPVELNDLRATDHSPGRRRLRLVYAARRGFDYFNPVACAALIDTVHGAYARRAGAFFGDVIAGSFQDELPSLPTWGAGFLEAFHAQAGYDLRPRLGLLWEGAGAEAQRARADYHAVRASLAEQAFFKPLFDWHTRHGLTCGFDQQGPARAGDPIASVRTYADYLKTQRWYGAPGSDHHGDAKIHSSLAHLYGRPRTWIEAFHSSGWGDTLEETFDWLLPWLRAGATLYSPHAAYYSTRGGWWEWAAPSTCWRQPFWRHYRPFADAISRLCDLLSQGRHVCDIGVLFPTTTIQAQTTPAGPLPAAGAAHDAYLALVGSMAWHATRPGVLDRDLRDYDVLDDDSVQRATIDDGALVIGAERYRAILLPACAALAAATAGVLAHFVEAGGLLIAVGQIPEIAVGADPAAAVERLGALFAEGRAIQVAGPEDVPAALARLPRAVDAPVPTLHRRIGERDVLFIPAAFPRATEVSPTTDWRVADYTFDPARYAREMTVRVRGARGAPQLWDALTGTRRNLAATIIGDAVEVRVPFDAGPAAVLVWPAPGEEEALGLATPPVETTLFQLERWEGELAPTLDNRYGDLDRPAYSGPPPVQTWRFEDWRDEPGVLSPADLQAEYWSRAEVGFTAYGWWFGPVDPARFPGPPIAAPSGSDALGVKHFHPAIYSLSHGIDRDPIHTRSLGPKGHVPEEFLDFGLVRAGEAIHFRTAFWLPEARALHLALGAAAAKRAWINDAPVGEDAPGYHWLAPVALRAGMNILDIEFTAEEDVRLRASWALVTRPERYARPEWMTASDPSAQGSRVTFSAALDLSFTPVESVFQIGANTPCRMRVNGVEVGRHGGFDPWEGSPAVQRFSTRALRAGANQIELEALEPGGPLAIVVDGLAHGPNGERASLMSGRDWRARRGEGPETAVTLRRRQWFSPAGSGAPSAPDMDPAFANLWRRPHPLPGAAWLEDTPADDTVLPVVPDAHPGASWSEWFRWTLPPGATSMRLPIAGAARLWVDDVELPIIAGQAVLPAVAVGRVALLGVAPQPGQTGGAVFEGPVTYETGRGPIELRPWAELGLGAYAGGLRYRTTFSLPNQEAGDLTLDLGQVRGTAEVWLNGAPAGIRFLSPYRFALTGLARAGENILEVLVCNTLAPYLRAVSPTHYVFPGQELSGLLGPVTIRR